jgi:transposase
MYTLVIAEKLEKDTSIFAYEIELDESCFRGVRKGKSGRGASGKTPMFGILKRGGKVYRSVRQYKNKRADFDCQAEDKA